MLLYNTHAIQPKYRNLCLGRGEVSAAEILVWWFKVKYECF